MGDLLMKTITIGIEEYEYLLGCKKRAETLRKNQKKYDESKKRKEQRKRRTEEIRKSIRG